MVIMESVVTTDTGDPVVSLFHDMVKSGAPLNKKPSSGTPGGHVSFITALAVPLPLKLAKSFPEKPSRPVENKTILWSRYVHRMHWHIHQAYHSYTIY